MLEPWDEVISLQRERQLCADDVQAIQSSCVKDHGEAHSPDCWNRLVNRIRDRYLNSASKEWFSGRRPFLLELDTLFSKAHNREVDFKTIEQRILDEKKEWYRDKIKVLGLQHATKSSSEEQNLQQRLNDHTIPTDQLISELRRAFSDGAVQNEEAFNGFIERLKLASTPQARTDAYVDIFFQPGHDPSGAARSQKYIDMVRNGVPVSDVINSMIRDRHAAERDQNEKQVLHRQLEEKLEELKRAKAAHELDKSKRDKARQDKARAAAALTDGQPDLPPCSACSTIPDPQDFIICPLCQILGDYYGLQVEPAIFCSQKCEDECYEAHVDAMHECASGQGCIQLHDEDVEMDEGGNILVCCRECVETLGIPSTFCSTRCLGENFQRHRDNIHLPERKTTHHEMDDASQLEFDPEDGTRYRARKIEEHIITFEDAVKGWQRKTGATVK
ncbi:hypothetical protein F4820DRAFT_83716 [Hypoxylon rubiginosum]|uniref:Uncharacterized protein n=1 Tax=Hypoxylon rubiginosum TaxID=110542 RepID=A0ACB9YP32_9PEZI|nr:hypothetical protein F4820DRAFT_83716 [Hypoxylon rubiginosum]